MRLSLVTLCVLSSCAQPRLGPVSADELRLAPASLALAPAYLGQTSSGTITVDNVGGRGVSLDVAASPPFVADVAQLSLGRGASAVITITLTPEAAGGVAGTLGVGALEVPLSGEGLAIPQCIAELCQAARFDLESEQCIVSLEPDGAACHTACVTAGQCTAGTCVGTQSDCDDADACTVDACSEELGCTHVERRCPAPSNPCQVATCDSSSGCGAIDVDDGTLCGPDDCLAPSVSVCVSGQCVARARPADARCTNTWVPTTLFARVHPAVTWDPVRRRVLLFGGTSALANLNDTWEWDGAHWSLRTPPRSPPELRSAAMAWDSSRGRAMLFGVNSSSVSETWEWDGVTWLQRDPNHTIPRRYGAALAYDSARRRMVLFALAETWEWNGLFWEQRQPPASPPARSGAAMAYDPLRRRVVLFGGTVSVFPDTDTWEWDGLTWVRWRPAVSPPARRDGRMTWNAARQRVVLSGGELYDWAERNWAGPSGDLWEWDGSTWQELPSTLRARSSHGLAWDDARSQLIAVGGEGSDENSLADTWAWDGSSWQSRTALAPEVRGEHAMAFDERRGRMVLFGGTVRNGALLPADTWEWDGFTWTLAATTGPSARTGHAMAWDPLRERVLLFGGDVGVTDSNETWEWDGAWVLRAPASSPSPRSGVAMAFDVARGHLVMVSESAVGGSWWTWDGTDWAPGAMTGPSSSGTMAFHEARQQLVFLTVAGGRTHTWTLESTPGASWQEQLLNPAPFPFTGYAMAYDRLGQRIIAVGSSSTWEWDGARWTELHPGRAPPVSNTNALAYDAARQRLLLTGEAGPWIFLP